MDPLTQLVDLLRPKALLWKRIEARGDWALRFPDERDIVFCLVTAGTCQLELHARAPVAVGTGDYLLLTAPLSYTAWNGRSVMPIDFETIDASAADHCLSVGSGGDGEEATQIIAGHFVFDTANADLLAGLLAPVIHVRASADAADRLRSILSLIGDEAASTRPGQALVLGRLLDVMLIESFRHHAHPIDVADGGLLAGLHDPQIASALRALHTDVGRGWTVAALAACASMSRSMFADRFTRVVGMAPIDYLLRWRMALAKDALRFSDRPIAAIARASGYQSVSAFSTAFSRIVGCPPARYAVRQRS